MCLSGGPIGKSRVMSATVIRAYDRVVVAVPAHNERANLPICLRAVLTAALCAPIPVTTVVVLDASDDGSAKLAGDYRPDVHFVSVDVRNVGAARAVGFAYARTLYGHDCRCWYATTDADSRVDPDWLTRQLELGADMVLGVVRIADWGHHSPEIANRYVRIYQADSPSSTRHHQHVHGANMGFSARAYWQVGCWLPERMSTWYVGLKPPATAFTETPNCQSRRRRAPRPEPRTVSPTP